MDLEDSGGGRGLRGFRKSINLSMAGGGGFARLGRRSTPIDGCGWDSTRVVRIVLCVSNTISFQNISLLSPSVEIIGKLWKWSEKSENFWKILEKYESDEKSEESCQKYCNRCTDIIAHDPYLAFWLRRLRALRRFRTGNRRKTCKKSTFRVISQSGL